MSGPEPGRAAYEALLAVLGWSLEGPPWEWDKLSPHLHEAWDAAAQAAIKAAELTWDEDLRRERDELTRQVSDLIAERSELHVRLGRVIAAAKGDQS